MFAHYFSISLLSIVLLAGCGSPSSGEAQVAPKSEELKEPLPPYATGIGISWELANGDRFDADYYGSHEGKVWLRRSGEEATIALPIEELAESDQELARTPAKLLRFAERRLTAMEGATFTGDWHRAKLELDLAGRSSPLEERVNLQSLESEVNAQQFELLEENNSDWKSIAKKMAESLVQINTLRQQHLSPEMIEKMATIEFLELSQVTLEIQTLRFGIESVRNSAATPEGQLRWLYVDRLVEKGETEEYKNQKRVNEELKKKALESHPGYQEAKAHAVEVAQQATTPRLLWSRQHLALLQEKAVGKLEELGLE